MPHGLKCGFSLVGVVLTFDDVFMGVMLLFTGCWLELSLFILSLVADKAADAPILRLF